MKSSKLDQKIHNLCSYNLQADVLIFLLIIDSYLSFIFFSGDCHRGYYCDYGKLFSDDGGYLCDDEGYAFIYHIIQGAAVGWWTHNFPLDQSS